MSDYIMEKLEAEIEEMGKKIDELIAQRQSAWDAMKVALEDAERAEEDAAALAEALEMLYDVDNGPALVKYEADHAKAVELTQAALERHRARHAD